MYVVSFVLLHPLGVFIASLVFNVKTKFPLVHAACVIVHVGTTVSISLNVTVTSTVVFSLSFSVITHVSLHVLLLLGVYVNVQFVILQLHFPPFVFTLP